MSINMKKLFSTIVTFSLVTSMYLFSTYPANASFFEAGDETVEYENKSESENLVNSKKKSDMTYKQMMQRMGQAYIMIQNGVIHKNKQLIRDGINMIQNHPAPKEKPWTIVKKDDTKAFKATLVSYNDTLHQSSDKITDTLLTNNWIDINEAVYNLSNNCVSCHNIWKDNLK